MRALGVFLLALGFVLFPAATVAGTRDPNTPDEKYVEFGKQFPSVVKLRAITKNPHKDADEKDKDKEFYQYGSAVIIKPNWVLTAAHVVTDTREPVVFLAGQPTPFPLQHVVIHAGFLDDNKFGFDDIALAYSSEDFNLKFYTPLYDTDDEVGKAVTIAGYGVNGTFISGAVNSDEHRRAGHNKIDRSERGVLICNPSSANRFPLEFLIASGDSGGGLFIGNKLAGINSFIMAVDKKPNGTYGDEGAHTRVSLYIDWIEQQIKQYELRLAGRATMGLPDLELVNPVVAAP